MTVKKKEEEGNDTEKENTKINVGGEKMTVKKVEKNDRQIDYNKKDLQIMKLRFYKK